MSASSSSSSSVGSTAVTPPPVVGAAVVAGLNDGMMEVAVTMKEALCSPVINRTLPVHYYGIFDGQGAPLFALTCKEMLHETLKEELMNLTAVPDESVLQDLWRVVMNRVFWRIEWVAHNTCLCGTGGFPCNCRTVVVSSGTTAAVVVLTEKHFVAANCGDSRAVLYRGDRIIPLTFDHKPSRPDEKARIKMNGGHIINIGDVDRVQGCVPVSRAIGYMFMKPFVISEPEVTFTRRDEEDEFLILASDGLWALIPTTVAGEVVRGCLNGTTPAPDDGDVKFDMDLNLPPPPEEPQSRFRSRSELAARRLARLAVARGSADSISVVVLDLKRDIVAHSI